VPDRLSLVAFFEADARRALPGVGRRREAAQHRVVGVERRTPSVCTPTWQIVSIQQNGGVTVATCANERGHAAASPAGDHRRGDIPWHESS
jgi:hypothetical protein